MVTLTEFKRECKKYNQTKQRRIRRVRRKLEIEIRTLDKERIKVYKHIKHITTQHNRAKQRRIELGKRPVRDSNAYKEYVQLAIHIKLWENRLPYYKTLYENLHKAIAQREHQLASQSHNITC